MFANVFQERMKKLEERQKAIQEKSREMNKAIQPLAVEFKDNQVRIALLKELEKEFGKETKEEVKK